MPCCQCLQLAHRIIRPSSYNSDSQSYAVLPMFTAGTQDHQAIILQQWQSIICRVANVYSRHTGSSGHLLQQWQSIICRVANVYSRHTGSSGHHPTTVTVNHIDCCQCLQPAHRIIRPSSYNSDSQSYDVANVYSRHTGSSAHHPTTVTVNHMPCCQCLQPAHRIIRPSSYNSDSQSYAVLPMFTAGTQDHQAIILQQWQSIIYRVANVYSRHTGSSGHHPTTVTVNHIPCCQCLQPAHRIIRPSSYNSDSQSYTVLPMFTAGTQDHQAIILQQWQSIIYRVANVYSRHTGSSGHHPTTVTVNHIPCCQCLDWHCCRMMAWWSCVPAVNIGNTVYDWLSLL